ncbi:hypothetical protein [Nocardioides sp. Kera G14]|uniref:hypothetical protein n=1 Tax=Nocardioides sp. Kera G14 TaxID=2884264 RepID=UPI001D121449|nr:hypothetical protein [Nocardioides sp. Kera G14]UDY24361.1 hypothetical protein LH076_03395 [Nocardioides sp. Kera G14]
MTETPNPDEETVAITPAHPDLTKQDPTVAATAEPRSGWHPVNIGQLVMGLGFLCIVGAWALVQADVVQGSDIRWLLPIPWLVAGAVGLAAAAFSSARRHGVRR